MTNKQPNDATNFYKKCLEYVIESYGLERVDHFRNISLRDIGIQDFFKEYSMVCLASGFRWGVIDALLNDLSEAFHGWDLYKIAGDEGNVFDNAIDVFGHKGKINAIIDTAVLLASWSDDEFEEFIQELTNIKSPESPGLAHLRRFRYIAKITQFHLARNLGLDFPKPDRLLTRAAVKYGYPKTHQGVFDFARRICEETNEREGVVDFVIWRFLADHPSEFQ